MPVSGSELREWPALAALRALGGTVHMAHEASNLDGVDTVVYSTAIPQDHVEMVEARDRGLRILHRSEALAAAMTGRQHDRGRRHPRQDHHHLDHDGDPAARRARTRRSSSAARSPQAGSNGHHGTGPYFVAEADESDKSFLVYRPHVSIITNIEGDHLNNWGDLDGLKAGFLEFAELDRPRRLRGHLRRRRGHPGADRGAAGRRAHRLHVRRGRRTPTCA